MAILRGIIGLVLAILVAAFAVANRQGVEIIWSPLHPSVTIPVYALALGLLIIGFAMGGLMAWLGSLPVRLHKHKQAKAIRRLEQELSTLRGKDDIFRTPPPPPAHAPAQDFLPPPSF